MTVKALVKHGPWGGPYTVEEAVAYQNMNVPRSGQTVSGYGKQLPTSWMICYKNRDYRVRVVCFSNSGTPYIKIKGVKTVVEILT